MTKRMDKILPLAAGFLSVSLLLLLWHFAATYTRVQLVFPTPIKVLKYLGESIIVPIGRYTLFEHSWFSLRRVLIGYGMSSVSGVIVGIAMGYSKTVNALIRPIFNIIRPIPGLAWIPLAILWFGIGEESKYFIIFIGGFANMVLNSYGGATKVDQQLVGAAQLLGASKTQIFFNIILPSSTPYIFAGLQVSLSTSWMAVLAAEMVSSNMGCGWIITMGMQLGDTVMILTGMIAIAAIGFILANAMRRWERMLCSWTIRGN